MRRTLLASLVAFALVAAACGSDDEPAATTTTAAPATTTTAAPTTSAAPTTTVAPTTTAAPEDPAVTFTGADGVESVIEDSSRVVVLTGDLVEVIFALGAGDRVAAVDVTAIYPAQVNELPRFGFGQQAAAEAILSFGPTLVIGDQLAGPAETFDQVRAAGVPVAILETQTSLEGVSMKIEQIALLLGVEEAGAELVATVEAEIAEAVALAETATESPRVAFVYIRGPETVFLFGQGTVTQALIEGANAVDTISESGVRALVPLTPEALVAAAPDVIVVPSIGLEALGGLEVFQTLPGIADTPAGQSGSFLTYEDTFFLNFGPRTGQALKQFVTDLHPELAG
jgi:iron complex transport system substrate-binding protein